MEKFEYLGSPLLTNDYLLKGFSVRIGMARASFMKLKMVLTGGLKHELKKRLVKVLVWSLGQ